MAAAARLPSTFAAAAAVAALVAAAGRSLARRKDCSLEEERHTRSLAAAVAAVAHTAAFRLADRR